MTSKTKPQSTSSANPQALKIGSRVRCTDDGVEGRIVWLTLSRLRFSGEMAKKLHGAATHWRTDRLRSST